MLRALRSAPDALRQSISNGIASNGSKKRRKVAVKDSDNNDDHNPSDLLRIAELEAELAHMVLRTQESDEIVNNVEIENEQLNKLLMTERERSVTIDEALDVLGEAMLTEAKDPGTLKLISIDFDSID